MELKLLDEQGLELTDIASHLGGSGQMVVDRVGTPGALFEYYFERGGRVVTMVKGAERYTAILGTRWQMGARFWFLHTFVAVVGPVPRSRRVRAAQDAGLADGIGSLLEKHAAASYGAPARQRTPEPRGSPR